MMASFWGVPGADLAKSFEYGVIERALMMSIRVIAAVARTTFDDSENNMFMSS